MPKFLSTLLACSLALAPALARGQAIGHEIEAFFDPIAKHLRVTDTLALSGPAPEKLTLTLAPRATGIKILAGSTRVRFTRSGETIRLLVPRSSPTLTLGYTLPLDAPPKELPSSMDTRRVGFGRRCRARLGHAYAWKSLAS